MCWHHIRLLFPPLSPGVCSNTCPLCWWCHPTISSSVIASPPAFNLSQHQGLFQWVSSSHQVAKVLELQFQHQSFQWIFRIDSLRIDLLAVQGTFRSLLQHHNLKASVLQCSTSTCSKSYICSRLLEKPYTILIDYTLTILIFIDKVMTLVFFFSFIFISWRLITLQYCSGFCHTLTWISHGFTCVPHPSLPRLPPHPIPLDLPSAPALTLHFNILSRFVIAFLPRTTASGKAFFIPSVNAK